MSGGDALWSGYEAAAATRGQMPQGADWSASGFSIDTRTIAAGEMFIALKDARDGHDFLNAAIEAGASSALVSDLPADLPEDFPVLHVPDVLVGLETMARAARDRCFGKLIAITGSAGKTSTKEMLRYALAGAGEIHAAERSFNNHIGVPLTLAALPARTDFGIFEIGMNHAGEIVPLVDMVKPHVAIVTTVAAAHLENLGSVEAIAAAKAEILTGLRSGGVAILPADNPHYDFLKGEAHRHNVETIIPFGEGDAAADGVRLLDFAPNPDGTAKVTFAAVGSTHDFRLASTGKHQAMNAMAVIAAGLSVGVPLGTLVSGLEQFKPGDGRGAMRDIRLDGKTVTILDESYNANPASMEAAFSVLSAVTTKGRNIAVLGDMKELGPTSKDLHAALSGPLQRAGIDLVFTVGEDIKALRSVLPPDMVAAHGATALELESALLGALKEGDAVLFKGSNASQVGKLVSALLAKADGQG